MVVVGVQREHAREGVVGRERYLQGLVAAGGLRGDVNAVSLASSFQAIGEAASAGGEWYMYYNPGQPFCGFTNEGNIYTILCGWAYGGPSVGGYYLGYNDGKEMFQWVEGWPGE